MTTKVRKGQAPDQLTRRESGKRFRGPFVDPALQVETEAIARSEQIAWLAMATPQGADHAQSQAGLCRSRPRPVGRLDRSEGGHRSRAEDLGRSEDEDARASHCGSPRNDGTCPREISKTFRLAGLVIEVR